MEKKIDIAWTPKMDALAAQRVTDLIAFTETPRQTNRAEAERAVLELYRVLGHEPCAFRWFDSPRALIIDAAKEIGAKTTADAARHYMDGQFSRYWFERYDFALKYVKGYNEELVLTRAIVAVCDACAGWLPCDEVCFMSEHPTVINVDETGMPSCLDGPAIGYKDGFGVYCVDGVLIPEKWVAERDSLKPSDVDGEDNAELRAILLRLYGMGKYIADSKSELVHEVPPEVPGVAYAHISKLTGRVYPYGMRGAKLWRRETKYGDKIQAVELLNSTVEIGGKRKTFFIGVTATASTVEEAVAKGYGFDNPADYNPVWET